MAQQSVETELHVAGVNSECLPEATESPQQRVHARERGCRWQRSGPRPKEHSYRAAKVEEKLEVHLVRMLGDALQDEREQRRVWALLDDARVRGEELRWREMGGARRKTGVGVEAAVQLVRRVQLWALDHNTAGFQSRAPAPVPGSDLARGPDPCGPQPPQPARAPPGPARASASWRSCSPAPPLVPDGRAAAAASNATTRAAR